MGRAGGVAIWSAEGDGAGGVGAGGACVWGVGFGVVSTAGFTAGAAVGIGCVAGGGVAGVDGFTATAGAGVGACAGAGEVGSGVASAEGVGAGVSDVGADEMVVGWLREWAMTMTTMSPTRMGAVMAGMLM